MTPRTVTLVICAAVILSALIESGCGTAEKLYPVTGQVFVNDRPAEGVYVALYPLSPIETATQQPSAGSARTSKDGSFSLQVRPGEYAVTVFWPKVTIEKSETIEGEDVFRGRYRNPKQPLQKVTIQEGDNTLPPIKLKSP